MFGSSKGVWLAGTTCDSDDKYTASGAYVKLPDIRELGEGEQQYLAIYDTGAYQDALASHHCLLSSPAKIVVQDGDITIADMSKPAPGSADGLSAGMVQLLKEGFAFVRLHQLNLVKLPQSSKK